MWLGHRWNPEGLARRGRNSFLPQSSASRRAATTASPSSGSAVPAAGSLRGKRRRNTLALAPWRHRPRNAQRIRVAGGVPVCRNLPGTIWHAERSGPQGRAAKVGIASSPTGSYEEGPEQNQIASKREAVQRTKRAAMDLLLLMLGLYTRKARTVHPPFPASFRHDAVPAPLARATLAHRRTEADRAPLGRLEHMPWHEPDRNDDKNACKKQHMPVATPPAP